MDIHMLVAAKAFAIFLFSMIVCIGILLLFQANERKTAYKNALHRRRILNNRRS